jgi:methyl-accepting chemotaxis protein
MMRATQEVLEALEDVAAIVPPSARWDRLEGAVRALIAESERWVARAGELHDQLRQEQEAHLLLAGDMQEQQDTTSEYEDMAYGAAALSEAAEEEIATLREALFQAQETIDELLAESAASPGRVLDAIR